MQQNDKQLADEGAKTLAARQSIRKTPEALDKLLNLTNQAQQLGVRSSESTVRGKLAAAESLARLSSVRAHIVKIADRALSNVSTKGGHSTAFQRFLPTGPIALLPVRDGFSNIVWG